MVKKDDAYYRVDEQLGEYPILNLDETGRDWIDYELPTGYQMSNALGSFLSANLFIQDLLRLNRDPSVYIVVLGYYLEDEDTLKVVYKHMPLYT